MQPDTSTTYLKQGQQLQRQGLLTEAEFAYRQAIELNPIFYGSFRYLGEVLALEGKLDQAVEAYQRAKELNPKALWVHQRLGEVFLQLNKLGDAIACFQTAIEINSDFSWAYNGLGECWSLKGNRENAIAAYQKAVELNPDYETFKHKLEQALAEPDKLSMSNRSVDSASNQTPEVNSERKYKIYDCFAFFNELDILRIRIEELKDIVDKFILVEATKTFSGNPKPLYYQEFIHEFAEYQDRIIHYVVDDMPEIDYSQPVDLQAWPLDVHQKNCISRVLNSLDCNDEDIILVNDCDEIPRKGKVSEAIELLKDNEFVIFVQDLYHGHLDNIFSEWWCGTVACKYKDYKVRTYTKVRYSDKINTGLDMGDPSYKRSGYISNQYFEHPYIIKSGWSFSWFGSDLSRRYKLQSFAHKEGDDSEARGIEKIKYDVCRPALEMEASGEFYFDVRDIEGKDVPEFLRNNILKYRHFLQPRQTALMAKLGGDFKQQVETQLNILKDESIKVKEQLQKGIQNLLKVCDSLAERGNLLEAIAQWRQLVELYPEFTSKKCFLSNLDGIKTWRINPDDYTLLSGQLIQTETGHQLVSQTGNYGQLCYGPYISLPDGLYRVKINLENSDSSGSQEGSNSENIWFEFDVAVNKGIGIYTENVYNNHQAEHEFFIDFINAQDLEIRFWATGLSFAVNFIELTLIYEPGADYYFSLGKSLQAKGEQKQALSAYGRAGEIDPENYLAKTITNWQEPEAFTELVGSLIDRGLEKQVIACYEQLFEGDSYLAIKAHHNLAIVLAKKGLTTEAITILQKASQKQLSEREIYETIWRDLNQLGINEGSQDLPTEIPLEAIYKHFSEKSHYQVINLWSLTDSERCFLEKEGLSVANLELVGKDDIELEEIYINSFDVSIPIQLSRTGGKDLREDKSHHDTKKGRYFQQSIVETGYVYAICPFSGRILRSNQSFICHHPHPEINLGSHSIFIYRFVGVEVFYLVCAVPPVGDKSFIYLPSRELVITFVPSHTCHASEERIINILKSKMVSCWQLAKSYISHVQKKEVVAVIGYMGNIGHFVWNELSGIQYLHESGNLQKIEKFLIGYFEYINLGATYPEIDGEKIINLPEPETLFETILVNNSVAVWPTDVIIKEDLANRIYQGAVKQCSPKLLQEIEKAKNHSPLIWIAIRSHYRVWLSQVEGIANIINKLYEDYPNLAVVFDGWGRHERHDPRAESEIQRETTIVEEILALVHTDIKTYSLIGKMSYERVSLAEVIDFYISCVGSGLVFPLLIANKPGLSHGHISYAQAFKTGDASPCLRENLTESIFLPADYVEDKPFGFANYDISWEKVYDAAMNLLKKIGSTELSM
ncbi:tetratricopeptide repeat protein [Planktothrix agardhii]|uniref:tetratricopeptide repeat protein n=1 Tax=Planktothrix agardhii TaxID=1160 RepID=UPI001F1C1FE2|nr:tetratricopeptide repeat protein [Planktothrix agardhii]MCF3576853.1 tetratricopeptide repeat protein [Planktothrix agardhii 1812]MCF3583029.1 tetratricopeptide repeat protein [Planktothrix agardhii 1811]